MRQPRSCPSSEGPWLWAKTRQTSKRQPCLSRALRKSLTRLRQKSSREPNLTDLSSSLLWNGRTADTYPSGSLSSHSTTLLAPNFVRSKWLVHSRRCNREWMNYSDWFQIQVWDTFLIQAMTTRLQTCCGGCPQSTMNSQMSLMPLKFSLSSTMTQIALQMAQKMSNASQYMLVMMVKP